MSRKNNSREPILDAAEAVVTESGAAHMTLDAVADRAGVSKGGLLYHFPSKEVLLQEMLARHLARADADREQCKARFTGNAAADLKAYITAGFEEKTEQQKVCAALLAAGANEPKLLSPVREWHQRNFQHLTARSRHPMRVLAIMLAIDGLWLNELLQTMPMSAKQRKQLLDQLLALAEDAV